MRRSERRACVPSRRFSSIAAGLPAECRGRWSPATTAAKDRLFYISSQGSHRIKRGLLDVFDLNDNQMHVVTPDVGGGFGPKGRDLSRISRGRRLRMAPRLPVKWIEDRRENFRRTHQERDQFWDLELRSTPTPGSLACAAAAHDTGAFVRGDGAALDCRDHGARALCRFQLITSTCGRCLHQYDLATPVRGAGRPEGVVVMERLMDRLAQTLTLDPRRGAAAQFHRAGADAVQCRHRLPRRHAGHL